jgi:hypothetical protein
LIRHSSNSPSSSQRVALFLRALVIVGYPTIGVIVSLIGQPSTVLSIPYRVAVLLLAIYVILQSLSSRRRGRIDGLLMVFLVAYSLRLTYDWLFGGIPSADTSLQFFIVAVVVPSIACSLAGTDSFSDEVFAKVVLPMGLFTLIMAYWTYLLGLGFNPWVDQGGETTRLAFQALNPISLGNVGVTCMISGIYLIYQRGIGRLTRIMSLFGVCLGIFIVIVANSRGPILGGILVLVWFLSSRIRTFLFLPLLLPLLPFLIFSENPLILNVLERFTMDVRLDEAAQGRLRSQYAAWNAFLESPIIGKFSLDPAMGIGFYPHNVIMESAMALGVVGVALLLIILARAGFRVVQFFNTTHPFLTLLLIQYFVSSQLSGTIWANDGLFMLLSLTLTARRPARNVSADFTH